jgi:hypothetical protein
VPRNPTKPDGIVGELKDRILAPVTIIMLARWPLTSKRVMMMQVWSDNLDHLRAEAVAHKTIKEAA